jgi:hypothetical protein
MDKKEIIPVEAVMVEKTHVGKVNFPVNVPQALVDWIEFPQDVIACAGEMGLGERDVKFVVGVLSGKWGMNPLLDLPRLTLKLGMGYPEMDTIVQGLIKKNYARLGERLELYRFWIVLLHVKGIRFRAAH